VVAKRTRPPNSGCKHSSTETSSVVGGRTPPQPKSVTQRLTSCQSGLLRWFSGFCTSVTADRSGTCHTDSVRQGCLPRSLESFARAMENSLGKPAFLAHRNNVNPHRTRSLSGSILRVRLPASVLVIEDHARGRENDATPSIGRRQPSWWFYSGEPCLESVVRAISPTARSK
jgi:hypothetical protein